MISGSKLSVPGIGTVLPRLGWQARVSFRYVSFRFVSFRLISCSCLFLRQTKRHLYLVDMDRFLSIFRPVLESFWRASHYSPSPLPYCLFYYRARRFNDGVLILGSRESVSSTTSALALSLVATVEYRERLLPRLYFSPRSLDIESFFVIVPSYNSCYSRIVSWELRVRII